MIAKARVAQLTGLPSITAAAEGPVTFGCFFYRWKARLLSGWGSSLAQGTGGRVRAPAPTAYPKVRLIFCRARCPHRAVPGRPRCAAPTAKTNRSYNRDRSPHPPRFARHLPLKGKACGRPLRSPLHKKQTGSVGSANPGAAVEMHHLKFYAKPGPSGPEEIAECHSDFARRKGCTMFKG